MIQSNGQLTTEYLSFADAARLIGVATNTLHLWRRSGSLSATRLPNGRYKVSRSEVERVAEAQHDECADRVSLAEAARMIGVSTKTLHQWIGTGRVNAMKLQSGQYRILRAEVEALTCAETNENDFLSFTDAARLIGVIPDTLRKWRAKGLVDAVELPNGTFKVARSEVERILTGEAKRGDE